MNQSTYIYLIIVIIQRLLHATFDNKLSNNDKMPLDLRVDKEDEMECLIRGCNFLLRNIPNEVFEFRREQNPPYVFQDLDHSKLFPYLLVNIGSGVSIVKVIAVAALIVSSVYYCNFTALDKGFCDIIQHC